MIDECLILLDDPVAREGFSNIAAKFDRSDGFGPTTVRVFLEGTAMPEGMTPDQIQEDAFRQVRALMQGLGLA